MIRLILLVPFFLSACAYPSHAAFPESCAVQFEVKTFPVNGPVILPVDKVRTDRFGRMSVHIQKNAKVDFLGSGWLTAGNYQNIDCHVR